MSDGVYPQVFGRSKKLSQTKFFDPSTPSVRKGNSGGKGKKRRKEKTDENSGHYVIASIRPPERHCPNDDRWNAPRSCQKSQVDMLFGLALVMLRGWINWDFSQLFTHKLVHLLSCEYVLLLSFEDFPCRVVLQAMLPCSAGYDLKMKITINLKTE